MNFPTIYLASQSPRRKELLQQIGVNFSVIHVDVIEEREKGETPAAMAERLAQKKAAEGWASLAIKNALVLAGDTLVELDGEVLGKPSDSMHAEIMLGRMAGRTHSVYSAVSLTNGKTSFVKINQSKVTFDSLSRERIKEYVATGESQGRAGSYAIQGLGSLFVKYIEGSYSGVMGLPLFETGQLLRKFSVPVQVSG